MNWYDNYKIAFPINQVQPSGYTQFGHEDQDYEEKHIHLWFIDDGFNFHVHRIRPPDVDNEVWGISGHGDIPGFFDDKNIAQGRYDETKHKTSLTFAFAGRNFSLHQREKIKERVEEMIDRKLNNPEIIETSPSYMWK